MPSQALARTRLSRLIEAHPPHLLREQKAHTLPYPLAVCALKAYPEILEAIEGWLEGLGLTELNFFAEGNRAFLCRAGKGQLLEINIYNDNGNPEQTRSHVDTLINAITSHRSWSPYWHQQFERIGLFFNRAIPDDFPFQLPPICSFRYDDPRIGRVEASITPELQVKGVGYFHQKSLMQMMRKTGWNFAEAETFGADSFNRRYDQQALLPDGTPVLIDGDVAPDPAYTPPPEPAPLKDPERNFDWTEENLARMFPHVRTGTHVTYHDGRTEMVKNGIARPTGDARPTVETRLPVEPADRKLSLGLNHLMRLRGSETQAEADQRLQAMAEQLHGSWIPGSDALAQLILRALENKWAAPLYPNNVVR